MAEGKILCEHRISCYRLEVVLVACFIQFLWWLTFTTSNSSLRAAMASIPKAATSQTPAAAIVASIQVGDNKDVLDMNQLPNVWIGGASYLMRSNGNPDKHQSTTLPSTHLLLPPLPTPIIVVGLPKAGTSTIKDFFRASGYTHSTSHWWCKKMTPLGEKIPNPCGSCMREAVRQSLPLLETCGNYSVWCQMDITMSPQNGGCHLPQIVNLQEIHREAPRATFILNRRNLTRWVRSVKAWTVHGFATMDKRLAACQEGPKSANVTDLIDWHVQHVQRIRQFVKDHPSHALVELDIEHESAAEIMATLFQTNATHWGHSNSNPKVKGNTSV